MAKQTTKPAAQQQAGQPQQGGQQQAGQQQGGENTAPKPQTKQQTGQIFRDWASI